MRCLPAELHNRPERIPAAVRALVQSSRCHYRSIFVAYADCGTGGMLDAVLKEEGVERIPGAHCYEFFATGPVFAELADAEPGTFYLTDFLLRHFDRLVLRGLGLDRHPELHSATSEITAGSCTWHRRPSPARWSRRAQSPSAWAFSSSTARPATARSRAAFESAVKRGEEAVSWRR